MNGFVIRSSVCCALLLLFCIFSLPAVALTPRVEGVSGAGRAGMPNEALFTNPASIGYLKKNYGFVTYTRSRVRNVAGGGRIANAGIYDGTSEWARGALAYIRESRLFAQKGSTEYIDYSKIRLTLGRQAWQKLYAGVTSNYVTRRSGGIESKYFYGDIGLIYPLFTDLPIGVTVENVTDRPEEKRRTVFLAARYDMNPLTLFGDIGRIVAGEKSGKNSWALGLEVKTVGGFFFRTGLFKDAELEKRGSSLGISWVGPRASFAWTTRHYDGLIRQRDYIFGFGLFL